MRRLTEKQLHILRQKLCDMKSRCYNESHKFYKDYGGRGITVCPEWLDKKKGHENFRNWAIENDWKEGLSIDRIDVNGNYEPSNCRWATPKQQSNNRRDNRYVTIKGVTKTAQEWADEIGITERAFVSRVDYGWSEDRLLEPKFKPLKMTKAEMSKEIRMWRSLEEQGLLMKLPCKVGDTFFKIICDGVIYELSLNKIMKSKVVDGAYTYCCNVVGREWDVRYIESTDKLIFLTKAEAEKALAEMEK